MANATVDEVGAPVELSVEWDGGAHHFVFADLEPQGSYRLRFLNVCGADAMDGGTIEVPFATGAESPLPEDFGEVALVEEGVANVDVSTSCGSCSVPRVAAYARFTLSAHPAAEPFLPVGRVLLRVDGELWAASEFGAGLSDGFSGSSAVLGRSVDDVYAVCERGTAYVTDDGLAVGSHQLTWSVEIAGTGEVPLGSAEVDLSCDGAEDVAPLGQGCDYVPDAGVIVHDAGYSPGGRGGFLGCFGASSIFALLVIATVLWLSQQRSA